MNFYNDFRPGPVPDLTKDNPEKRKKVLSYDGDMVFLENMLSDILVSFNKSYKTSKPIENQLK